MCRLRADSRDVIDIKCEYFNIIVITLPETISQVSIGVSQVVLCYNNSHSHTKQT